MICTCFLPVCWNAADFVVSVAVEGGPSKSSLNRMSNAVFHVSLAASLLERPSDRSSVELISGFSDDVSAFVDCIVYRGSVVILLKMISEHEICDSMLFHELKY